MKRIPFRTAEDATNAVDEVRAHLDAGGIIAYPTETVYGLGCAVAQKPLHDLLELKGREATKSFLLLDADPTKLTGLRWTLPAHTLAEAFWPGPLTIALAADGTMYQPPVMSAQETVAVRQTPHPQLAVLLQALGEPITSTSANNAGDPAATSADDVEAAFATTAENILLLDGGPIRASAPSTIVDCAEQVPRLVREGAIPADALRTALISGGYTLDV